MNVEGPKPAGVVKGLRLEKGELKPEERRTLIEQFTTEEERARNPYWLILYTAIRRGQINVFDMIDAIGFD